MRILALGGAPLGDARPDARRSRPVAGPVVARPVREVLAARWFIVREQWAMTTFYLFDPDSWR